MNVINELTYRSYRWNRLLTPEVDAARWQLIFGPAAIEMEARFQRERLESEVAA